jgi:hypothetical protein
MTMLSETRCNITKLSFSHESGYTWHTLCCSVWCHDNDTRNERGKTMAPEELTALDAQIDALDQESACRVARLVIECGASIPLAMQAVADADARRADVAARQRRSSTPSQKLACSGSKTLTQRVYLPFMRS